MGREQTLLDRLAHVGVRDRGRSQATTEEDVDALAESVRRNLRRLLNARQGMCEAQLDYGLPALADLATGSEDYVRRVEEAIRLTIEKYEPRLRRVRVTPHLEEARAETLVFRVDALLVGRSGELRVWYETSLAAGGQFEVAG
ncbi:MAG: type VI secretion system baseplate subunit TssE [Phycisphaerae bacterium]|nr:type VI secretion system baseplate subunit TssE [Phycisphaerae bacterium]